MQRLQVLIHTTKHPKEAECSGTQHARLTTQSYLSLINPQWSRNMHPSVSSASLNMARWISWWTALILHRGKRTFIFSLLTWVKRAPLKSSRSSDSFACCLRLDWSLNCEIVAAGLYWQESGGTSSNLASVRNVRVALPSGDLSWKEAATLKASLQEVPSFYRACII